MLGWVVHGRLPKDFNSCKEEFTFQINSEQEDTSIHRLVRDYFSLESFGTKPGSCRLESKEDVRARKILRETTRKLEDRYETGLLWKHDEPQLPESRTMALKRLKGIERKMDRDPAYAARYSTQMEGFLEKGYARKLTPEEIVADSPKLWYLPHFAVVNPNKPDKMRLVFDAAAKSCGISLNDALMAGPDFLTALPGHLFNFRHYAVAVTGDIKEMFPQIKICEEDQAAQRFLWRGMDRDRPPDEYLMNSMIFGAKSSPCSAQYVRDFNAGQFGNRFPGAVHAILQQHYMDNYLTSFRDVREAKNRVQEVYNIHTYGGFKMCSWLTNDRELLDWIPPHLRAENVKDLDIELGLPQERILGLSWDPNLDTLNFNLKFHRVDDAIMKLDRPPTKREFL
ncbi:unnamed protein product, partial [Allacma fusca]